MLTGLAVDRAPAASSYKANVNRTKTRKWVEAKVQSYDGDDWGNDYDDYDDGNDQYDEPEPPPAATTRATGTGLRQPAQAGYQLPSSRTFPQSTTSSYSPNPGSASRVLGPSALRGPGGHPSLHVQTQSAAEATTSPPYASESAFPATVSSRPSEPAGPYSAGPTSTSTPSRFPPRKSSMGQHDRPNLDKIAPKPDSRPGSSSGNRPRVDQPVTSPGQVPAPAAKTLPFIRPSDIYKRIGEEKEREKERLSMDSERPSTDGAHGRTESAASAAQFRTSTEQHRRTSLEDHDGSESARARKSSLAPVAERKSEYGMDGFLVNDPTNQPPAIQEPAMTNPALSRLQNEPNDEIKADLAKSRRFSTSPQLPNLTRVSGFGDDFFSGSRSYSPRDNVGAMAVPTETTKTQPSYTLEDVSPKQGQAPISNNRGKVAEEEAVGSSQAQPSSSRPQLPGTWVSESAAVPTSFEQPLPPEERGAERPGDLADLHHSGISPITESNAEPSDEHPAAEVAGLPSSIDTFEGTSKKLNGAHQPSEYELGGAAGQHDNSTASGGHYPTPQLLPPLKTGNLLAQSSSTTASSTPKDKGPQTQISSTGQSTAETTTRSEFSPTAPLNTTRAPADSPDFVMSSPSQPESVISTVETVSPEKESDKLREEIIKSLSPAPHSPGLSSFNAESNAGDLTRESRYLSGVYDDYLSLSEEKSLQEVSQAAKSSNHMASSPSSDAEIGPVLRYEDAPVSQPAPLNSVQSPASENPTRLRRFSWQDDPEEVTLSPADSRSAVSVIPHDSLADSRGSVNVGLNTDVKTESPVSGFLQAEAGAAGALSPQVSQVSSLAPEDSLGVIESPSPISLVTTRPNPASDEPNIARLSLAEEKEKLLVGDAQSIGSNASEQHPALTTAPEQDDGPFSVPLAQNVSPVQPAAVPAVVQTTARTAAPTPFRDILNLATYEERVQKFDETREQFYLMDSGLSNWLTYLQSQPEHTHATALSDPKPLLSKPGAPPTFVGAPGAPPVPAKTGTAVSHSRRTSIGNMQQLVAGQSSSFGASGNQVGTKSKELLHAAGAFGNKGVKSGMKLFNKGKNKLRR